MTNTTSPQRQPGHTGQPTTRLSVSPTGLTGYPDTEYPVKGESDASAYKWYHPLLHHLPRIDWAVFGTVTWKNAGRRLDSDRASQNREKDFNGALHQTCAVLKLHTRDLVFYRATEFGAAGECHYHFLVAKVGLRHITPEQFAKVFTQLWTKVFRPWDAKFCGVGKAKVVPYDYAKRNRGVSYCLEREFDEHGNEQERYDCLSPKLFNLLRRLGSEPPVGAGLRGVLDENLKFSNN